VGGLGKTRLDSFRGRGAVGAKGCLQAGAVTALTLPLVS
jgi:hypothetical protein